MASYTIGFHYDKALAHPDRVGHGYDQRPDTPLTGVTLHSTNGAKGSTFIAECAYLRDSTAVSAHYVVGKHGEIERILDPGVWRAWHAGVSSWRGVPDCNDYAVGIEFHHSVGDPWYPQQLDAGAWLCRLLMTDHKTITQAGIMLHRWCALPMGRKEDPEGWTNAAARAWIAAL